MRPKPNGKSECSTSCSRAGAAPSSKYETIVGTTLSQVQPVIDRHVPKTCCRKFRRHHQTAAVRQRRQHRDRKSIDVIERQHRGDAIACCPTDARDLSQAHLQRGSPASASHPSACRSCRRCTSAVQAPQAPDRSMLRPHPHCGLARKQSRVRIHLDQVDRTRNVAVRSRKRSNHSGAANMIARIRVVNHVTHLLRLRQQVDRMHAIAAVHRTQQKPICLNAISEHQRHMIARLQRHALQASRLQRCTSRAAP